MYLCQWFVDQQIDGEALMAINFRELIDLDPAFEVAAGNNHGTLLDAIAALRAAGILYYFS